MTQIKGRSRIRQGEAGAGRGAAARPGARADPCRDHAAAFPRLSSAPRRWRSRVHGSILGTVHRRSDVVLPDWSLVEIDLIEQKDGTLLRLTHTGLPNAAQCAGHAEGWAHYLGRLGEVAAARDPGPDRWHGRIGTG